MMAGLLRTPATVAIYRTRRTWARPPQIQRLPAHVSTVAVKWCETGQCGDLLAIEHSQFGQVHEQRTRKHLADTGHGTQQFVAFAPEGSVADQIGEFIVEARKALFQPPDVLIDTTVQNLWGAASAIFLRSQHLDQLAPARNQCFERLGLFSR